MPIYEYRCQKCGTVFDAIRKMDSADEPIACENCQSTETTRLLSKCVFNNQDGSSSGNAGACGNCSGGSCSTCGH